MSKNAKSSQTPNSNKGQNSLTVADRGWYLAVEYSTVANQDKFQSRLAKLRELGQFKELLEPDGKITYRNLFRQQTVTEAWNALTVLKPWRAKVDLYLNGQKMAWKAVSDLVWCAGYLQNEEPCRGNFEARRFEIGCGHAVNLAPFHWDRVEDKRRHIMSFASFDGTKYVFDVDAVLEFLNCSQAATLCLLSPTKSVAAWQKALVPLPLTSLNWHCNVALSPEMEKHLGNATIKRVHSYFRLSGTSSLLGEVTLLLRKTGDKNCLFRFDHGVKELVSDDLDLSGSLNNALSQGASFLATRKGERYSRRPNRQNDIEETFVLKTAFLLEDPGLFSNFAEAYAVQPIPSATMEYREWVKFVMNCMKLKSA